MVEGVTCFDMESYPQRFVLDMKRPFPTAYNRLLCKDAATYQEQQCDESRFIHDDRVRYG